MPKIRILHICESFDPGGVVWWLIDIVKILEGDGFHFDFYCCGTNSGMRAQEVTDLGCGITLFRPSVREVLFGSGLRKVLSTGSYDIVHAHIFNLSGWMLRQAHHESVPVRIVHYHNTNDGRPDTSAVKLRRSLSRRIASLHANAVLACSEAALSNAPRLRTELVRQVVHYGIDSARFAQASTEMSLCTELAVPPQTPLIGHVGRFYPQKNHDGLVRIFAQVIKARPDAHLVLIGDGPLRPHVAQLAQSLGIGEHVHFLGARTDVPSLLPQLTTLAFPSLHEGLPVAVLEARMAGIPVVGSNIPAIAEALAGSDGYALVEHADQRAFAEAIISFLRQSGPIPPPATWRKEYSREGSAARLAQVYVKCLADRAK